MANCFQPMIGAMMAANQLKMSLDIELGLSYGLGLVTASGGVIRPLVLSPDAEMIGNAMTPGVLQFRHGKAALSKYTSADIEILHSNPEKLARFVEVTPRACMRSVVDRDHPFFDCAGVQ